jgi:hypothetical protein
MQSAWRMGMGPIRRAKSSVTTRSMLRSIPQERLRPNSLLPYLIHTYIRFMCLILRCSQHLRLIPGVNHRVICKQGTGSDVLGADGGLAPPRGCLEEMRITRNIVTSSQLWNVVWTRYLPQCKAKKGDINWRKIWNERSSRIRGLMANIRLPNERVKKQSGFYCKPLNKVALK